jgi:hypothetical protein
MISRPSVSLRWLTFIPAASIQMPLEGLIVCKFLLRKTQMTDASYVDHAAYWAAEIVERESRGPGDLDNAMHRAARHAGVPYSALWALRYRKPKDVLASIYFALRDAYEMERARQLQALKYDLEITSAKAGPHANSVRAAVALVHEADLTEACVADQWRDVE